MSTEQMYNSVYNDLMLFERIYDDLERFHKKLAETVTEFHREENIYKFITQLPDNQKNFWNLFYNELVSHVRYTDNISIDNNTREIKFNLVISEGWGPDEETQHSYYAFSFEELAKIISENSLKEYVYNYLDKQYSQWVLDKQREEDKLKEKTLADVEREEREMLAKLKAKYE